MFHSQLKKKHTLPHTRADLQCVGFLSTSRIMAERITEVQEDSSICGGRKTDLLLFFCLKLTSWLYFQDAGEELHRFEGCPEDDRRWAAIKL